MKPYYPLFLLVGILLLPIVSQAQQLDYFVTPTHINKIVPLEDDVWLCTNSGLVQLNLKGEVIKHHHFRDGFEIGKSDIDYLGEDKNGVLYARYSNVIEDENLVYYKNGANWEPSKKYSQPHIVLLPFEDGHFGYYDKKRKAVFIEKQKGWLKKKIAIKWYEEEDNDDISRMISPIKLSNAFFLQEKGDLWLSSTVGVLGMRQDTTLYYEMSTEGRGLEEYRTATNLCYSDGVIHFLLYDLFVDYEMQYYKYNYAQNLFYKDSLGKAVSLLCANRENGIYKLTESKDRIDLLENKMKVSPKKWRINNSDFSVVDFSVDQNGTIWLVSFEGNLYRSEKDSFRYIDLTNDSRYKQQEALCNANSLVTKDGKIFAGSYGFFSSNCISLDSPKTGVTTFLAKTFTEKERLFFAVAMPSIAEVEAPLHDTWSHIAKTYDLNRILGEEQKLLYAYYDAKREYIFVYNEKGRCRIFSPYGIINNTRYNSYEKIASWQHFSHLYYSQKSASLWIYNSVDLYKATIKDGEVTITNLDSTSFPVEEEVRGIYEDKEHQIWVQTKVAVYRYKDSQWTRFGHKALGIKKEQLLFNAVFREDKAGDLLLLTKKGLVKWDGNQWSMELQWKGEIKRAKPTKFWLEDNNTIWISGLHKGIFQIDLENSTKVTTVSNTLNLKDWAKEKKTGVIWFLLTYGEGVCKYTP